ncbi:hypothetical protein HPP92_024555 [Vanilla planifolia]|uniref:Uncharacterized protein n=1 Tax=Vanilla planifolia TaxID=51239 RepID=A0A835PSF8_VANPL|nr:hypothetical protein HPP92_024858 [Vanilla planifolia]KAG0456767.1 hypothetical protein HPP92_024555 [Vanilla planifolia]
MHGADISYPLSTPRISDEFDVVRGFRIRTGLLRFLRASQAVTILPQTIPPPTPPHPPPPLLRWSGQRTPLKRLYRSESLTALVDGVFERGAGEGEP